MTIPKGSRCWKYGARENCRNTAGNSLRRGDSVFHYCDDPDHDPRNARDHIDAIDAWVKEAALDLGMDEDTVWHDVALAYLQCEVHDPSMKVEVGQGLGLDADIALG